MINNCFCILLASIFIFAGNYGYQGSTTAVVTLVGGIIKAKHVVEVEKKYKRSKCPVCKGKGWYISGDNISKVPCGYCEPDTGEKEVTHPPIIIRSNHRTIR